MIRWLRTRGGSTAFVVALILGPVIAMLFIGRWRWALGWFAIEFAAVLAPYPAAAAIPGDQEAWLWAIVGLLAARLAGAVHAARLAGGEAGAPAWYARWPVLVVIVLAGVVGTEALRIFGIETFAIPSAAMEPTLRVGDLVVVNKAAYGFTPYSGGPPGLLPATLQWKTPAAGDIAVFRLPRAPSVTFIKRVVAGPGDTVQVRGGVLHVNGEAVRLGEADPGAAPGWRPIRGGRLLVETLPGGARHLVLDSVADGLLDDTAAVTIPAGHVFVMGDHRDNSMDSRVRETGTIPIDHVVGKVVWVAWNEEADAFPWGRLSRPAAD